MPPSAFSKLKISCPICSKGTKVWKLTPEQIHQRKVLHFNREFLLIKEKKQLLEQLKKENEVNHFNVKMMKRLEEMSRKDFKPSSPPQPPPKLQN